MSIIVVCPGCRKSFKVSDKFAGRSGPCPKCKRVIEVPAKDQEVKIHAPVQHGAGGRTKAGKLALKPVAFVSTKLDPVATTIIVASVLIVLAATWMGGRMKLFEGLIPLTVGLLLISPPLALGGYTILRDDELEPYSGVSLYIRSALCALAYVVLWGIFDMLAAQGVINGELWVWVFVGVPFLSAGGGIAVAAFDLDFGNGVLHYAFYLLVTVVLHRAAGLKWIWDISS
jgi:hypothetical protein